MMTLHLAPLAGVTDWVFRVLCMEQGCDVAYTEMVSAMGYICAPKGNCATESLLFRSPLEKKLIVQIFGKDPLVMAKAAEELSSLGIYDGIDINMGCPVHKVACSGEGSGLMRTPDIAKQVMENVVRASSLPVTVKMRLGWDQDSINVETIAKMAEDVGVSGVTIHGRTRQMMYSGKSDWNMIAKVKQQLSIPVTGNGDIFTGEDAVEKQKISGVDGIMAARGAMGNPWLFSQIRAAEEGRKAENVTLQQKIAMAKRHYQMESSWREEKIVVREMRKHIGWYLHGEYGAAQIRDKINKLDTMERVFEMLDDFQQKREMAQED